MSTLGAVGTARNAALGDFGITLGFLGLALLRIAFAWDGLVRRQMLVPGFPYGPPMGQQAAFISRMRARVIEVLCLLACAFLLLLVWGTWMVAAQQDCRGEGSLACMGSLLGTVHVSAWGWFGLWVGWFMVVWLWMGDPRKRVLVYGVWHHQERVARQVNRQLRAQRLAPLPRERLYVLEDSIVRLLREHGWLEQDPSSAPSESESASPQDNRERLLAEVQRKLAERGMAWRSRSRRPLGYCWISFSPGHSRHRSCRPCDAGGSAGSRRPSWGSMAGAPCEGWLKQQST